MKRIISLMLVTIVVIVVSSCGTNTNTQIERFYKVETNNYSLDIPAEWTEKNGENVTYYYANSSNFVMISEPEYSDAYLEPMSEEFINEYIDGICGTLELIEKPQYKETSLGNGIKGIEINIKCQINDDDCYFDVFVFTNRGYLDSIAFIGSQKELDQYSATYDEILKSIRIVSAEESQTSIPTHEKELTEREKIIVSIGGLFDKKLAFDTGDYAVGDIPEGEYAFIGLDDSKYYCEKDVAGNIIDNENFQSFGYVYVHGVGNIETKGVLVNVSAFEELGVSGAKEIYEIIYEQSDYMQSGMYKIGADISSGNYEIESIGSGYFSLLTGPVGNNEIIINDNFNGSQMITTSDGQYLELTRAMIVE